MCNASAPVSSPIAAPPDGETVEEQILTFIADTLSGGFSLTFAWTQHHDGVRSQRDNDGNETVWINAPIGDPDESGYIDGESFQDAVIDWMRRTGTPKAVAELNAAVASAPAVGDDRERRMHDAGYQLSQIANGAKLSDHVWARLREISGMLGYEASPHPRDDGEGSPSAHPSEGDGETPDLRLQVDAFNHVSWWLGLNDLADDAIVKLWKQWTMK